MQNINDLFGCSAGRIFRAHAFFGNFTEALYLFSCRSQYVMLSGKKWIYGVHQEINLSIIYAMLSWKWSVLLQFFVCAVFVCFLFIALLTPLSTAINCESGLLCALRENCCLWCAEQSIMKPLWTFTSITSKIASSYQKLLLRNYSGFSLSF